ncbi:helix-turn-helix domain-containing protein [Halosegnis longus]|uniref:Transcriptional regulator n=1 Tax=Halosegnis longus TaxID=2216012 RepID=A0AAJ4R6K7_9EURY|nr:transcriptional regulator [Salella cibi]
MSQTKPTGTRLTLDLWHPDCWAIEATSKTAGGVLAHAVYSSPEADSPESVNGLFTAFGESESEVDALLDEIRDVPHGGNVHELQERFGRERDAPGRVVTEFFLEYDPDDMVCPTLLEHGFVHSAPVRIKDGREEWQVVFAGDRSGIEPALDGVREQADATVEVESITSGDPRKSPREQRLDSLTPTQREAFETARAEGYYEWPREATTRELAAELDVSKTTYLEHLRKAEAKLLNPSS